MPCMSTDFRADVKLGDFTVTREQLEDVLEPEPEQPALTKQQIDEIVKNVSSTYRGVLRLHGYSDLSVV